MPQKDDDQASATKQDIALLMQQMGKLYDATEKWKDEILDATEKWKDEILDATEKWKSEIIGEFHIVVGQLRHDFKGAFADKLQQHEDRIDRLERHAGLTTV